MGIGSPRHFIYYNTKNEHYHLGSRPLPNGKVAVNTATYALSAGRPRFCKPHSFDRIIHPGSIVVEETHRTYTAKLR